MLGRLFAASISVVTIFPISISYAQANMERVLSLVDACDVLAAHPDDLLRVAPGVSDEELVPRLAEQACETALATSDDVARHAFQLGRAKLGLDQRDAALQLFEEAAKAGSTMSMIFLGDAAQFGWTAEPDPVKALSHYTEARTNGLLIADIAIEQLTFDSDIFTTGPMLEVLVNRDIETAAEYANNPLARSYLYAFTIELSDRCGSFLQPSSVAMLQNYRFPPGWSAASEEGDRDLGVQDVLATYDVEVLVDRHGCSGYVIETIAGSFNDMLVTLNARGQ